MTSPPDAPSRRLPPWWPWAAVGTILAVIGLTMTVWATGTSAVAADVEVTSAGSPECEGATFRTRQGREVLVVTPQTRCVYTFEITNHGVTTVHLDALLLPYLGAGGGGVVRADPTTGDLDAPYPLDRDLEPGESTTVTTVVRYRPRGCTAGITWFHDWPKVELTSFGRALTLRGADTFTFTYRGGQNPGCRA